MLNFDLKHSEMVDIKLWKGFYLGRKRQIIITIVCVCTGICLAGGICIAVVSQRNPLAKGMKNLAEELVALEEDTGKNFWSNAVNQIGNGNVQAEYSLNIGGIPELQNITVGLDGTVKRDMENRRFGTDIRWSVANTDVAESALFATEDTLYLQIPSVWSGSVVMKTEDVDGQWNDSSARKQLQRLTGMELGIRRNADARFMQCFSVNSFSTADFLGKKREELKSLYSGMEVWNIEKAKKRGLLSEEQAEELESYIVEDEEEEKIETTRYLAVLPGKELGEILEEEMDDIRLCVYLDPEKRIVRVSTLPGESLVTERGKGVIALNLTGAEATIDRLEGEFSYRGDETEIFDGKPEPVETEGKIIIERDAQTGRSYSLETDLAVRYQENRIGFSLKGSVEGEQLEEGESLSVDLERLTVESEDKAICRMSGKTTFEPLGESIALPAEKEYRIGEMGDAETVLFFAECLENIYKNYSGYIKMMELQ